MDIEFCEYCRALGISNYSSEAPTKAAMSKSVEDNQDPFFNEISKRKLRHS